jgi:hypothetical protein
MIYKGNYILTDKLSLHSILIRTHLILNNIVLQEQQIVVLTYFSLYGIGEKTTDYLVDNKIIPTKQIISNTKTILKEKGLITKIRYNRWELTEKLRVDIDDTLILQVKCKQNK